MSDSRRSLIRQAIQRTELEAQDPFGVWNIRITARETRAGQHSGISQGWIRVCAEQRLETLRGLSEG